VLEAWHFFPGCATPTELDADTAIAHVREPGAGVVWLDIEHPTAHDLRALDEAAGLGEFLVEDLLEGMGDAGQRTKLQPHGDVFHVAVRDCSVAGRQLLEREIDLVFGNGWLCSVRHPLPDASADLDPDPFPRAEVERRLLAQWKSEPSFDVGFVLWAFLDVVTDRYLAVTDAIDERLDHVEEILLDDGDGTRTTATLPTTSPRMLFDIGRLLTQFRHQVIPLREVVGALLRREDPAIGDAALLHFRDVYDHLLGLSELVESQRDVLAGLRDVHLTVVSNNMNRSMQQLAAWGAILIVATLVTGVLGMNFRDAPDVEWQIGFLAVTGIIALITAPMWWFFRRRKWL
jgi:magnesium transporter